MSRYEAKINITDTIYKKFSTPLFTGDIGNTVHLEFFLRGKPYTASNANVYKLMPDGKSASVAVTMKDNVCDFTIPNVMHSNASESEIELQIALLDDIGNILTSGVLYFEVKEGLSEKTQIAGTDEYNDMTALLSQTAKAASAANEAAVRAAEAVANLIAENVLRYKGTVDTYTELPSNPEVGDVYNIRSAFKTKAYAMNISKVRYNSYINTEPMLCHEEYYMYVDRPSDFSVGKSSIMFDSEGKRISGFSVQVVASDCINEIYEDNADAKGLGKICHYLHFKYKKPNEYSGSVYNTEVGQKYYFTGLPESDDSIDVTIVSAGDNVVWNGHEWDSLGGTLDLSSYATTDLLYREFDNIILYVDDKFYAKNEIDNKFANYVTITTLANYSTTEEVSAMIDSAIGTALEGEY